MVDWILSEMGLRLAEGSTAVEKPVGNVAQPEPQTGKPHAYNGYIPNKESKMATQTFSPFNNIEAWDDVMGQMIAFVNDTNADIDMAYDWVCEMLDIPPSLIMKLHGILSTTTGNLATIATT